MDLEINENKTDSHGDGTLGKATLGDERDLPQDLQTKFIDIVKQMIENKVDLPKDFELFYLITTHSDRAGSMIRIDAFLTEEKAKEIRNFRGKWSSGEGKYGWCYHHYEIVGPDNESSTENYAGRENEDYKDTSDDNYTPFPERIKRTTSVCGIETNY